MELEELIKKGSSAIRNSNELMGFFVKYYEDHFNDKPECYPCAFDNTFKKLKNKIFNTKETNMNKTFVLKKGTTDRLAYKYGHRTFRMYTKDAHDDFIKNYLTYGKEEEIEQRKLMFEKFPDGFEKEIEVEIEVNENKDALSNKKAKTKRNKQ